MAVEWKNIDINKILYSTTPDHDADLKSPKATEFNSTTITLNLNMNFVERQFIINFYTFGDILAKLGGLRASIMPIIGQLTPLFILFFLLSVAKVIKNKIQNNYETRLKEFIINAKVKFQSILDAKLELKVELVDKINELIKELEASSSSSSINDLEELNNQINEMIKEL